MNKREQEKLQRERQEDLVLNKVLWWIVGAVILEFHFVGIMSTTPRRAYPWPRP